MTSSSLNGDEKPNENSYVLDSSALLSVILREPGADVVEEAILAGAVMSTVNFAEVVSRLVDLGLSAEEAEAAATEPEVPLVPFDERQALLCGLLRARTRRLGLSLGDRACLAVGAELKMPVLTADRAWAQLDVGVDIVVCR